MEPAHVEEPPKVDQKLVFSMIVGYLARESSQEPHKQFVCVDKPFRRALTETISEVHYGREIRQDGTSTP